MVDRSLFPVYSNLTQITLFISGFLRDAQNASRALTTAESDSMQEAGAGVLTVMTPGERPRTAPSTTALHILATCDPPLLRPATCNAHSAIVLSYVYQDVSFP